MIDLILFMIKLIVAFYLAWGIIALSVLLIGLLVGLAGYILEKFI